MFFIKRYKKHITSHKKSLFTIINSINPYRRIINTILAILVSLMFEHDEDKKRIKVIKKILKHLRKIDREGKNSWQIISEIIMKNKSLYTQQILVNFLKGLLLILGTYSSLFLQWSNEMEKGRLLKSMKTNDIENYYSKHFLTQFKEQRQMLIHGINMKIVASLSLDTKRPIR